MDPADQQMLVEIGVLLKRLKARKPNDRSDKDRHYAVAITEAEKLLAWFYVWVALGGVFPEGE